MGENVKIRPAVIEDFPVILGLYGDLAKAYADGERQQSSEPDPVWQECLNDKRQHILVAEVDGEVIGTLTCIIVPNLGHGSQPWAAVTNVVVNGSLRGGGIGTKLLAEAGTIARRENCYKIVLSSNLLRTEAHEFYRRLGWQQSHIGFSLGL